MRRREYGGAERSAGLKTWRRVILLGMEPPSLWFWLCASLGCAQSQGQGRRAAPGGGKSARRTVPDYAALAAARIHPGKLALPRSSSMRELKAPTAERSTAARAADRRRARHSVASGSCTGRPRKIARGCGVKAEDGARRHADAAARHRHQHQRAGREAGAVDDDTLAGRAHRLEGRRNGPTCPPGLARMRTSAEAGMASAARSCRKQHAKEELTARR